MENSAVFPGGHGLIGDHRVNYIEIFSLGTKVK